MSSERSNRIPRGNDHTTDCIEIMLLPSGTASYSEDATWGYRRAPFMGEWTTGSGGPTPTMPPSPAKGGDISAPTQQPEAPKRFEVWYQQAPQATGASPEPVPTPPQPTSSTQQLPQVTPAGTRSASRKQAPTMTSTSESSPEPPPPASPVSLLKAPVASASSQAIPAPQPPLPPLSERQEAPVARASSEAVPKPMSSRRGYRRQ